jgi:hypothetical protein
LGAELIGNLTRDADENLRKQSEVGVQSFIAALTRIADAWEAEEATTQSTTPTTSSTPTASETPVTDPITEPSLTTSTLAASSLTVHFALLLIFLAVLSLLE